MSWIALTVQSCFTAGQLYRAYEGWFSLRAL